MKAKTLTEITTREAEEREQAFQFEQLHNEQVQLKTTIKRSEAAATDDANVLGQIIKLTERLSADAITGPLPGGGHSFVPAMCEARSIVRDVCLGTLRQVKQRDGKREAELKTKRERLAEVEKQLKEFE